MTRNLEIRNSLVSVVPNIWRLGQVQNTKLCTNVSNQILLNAIIYQGLHLLPFQSSEGKTRMGGEGVKLSPTQVRINEDQTFHIHIISNFCWILLEICKVQFYPYISILPLHINKPIPSKIRSLKYKFCHLIFLFITSNWLRQIFYPLLRT